LERYKKEIHTNTDTKKPKPPSGLKTLMKICHEIELFDENGSMKPLPYKRKTASFLLAK